LDDAIEFAVCIEQPGSHSCVFSNVGLSLRPPPGVDPDGEYHNEYAHNDDA
jgi:hypothetical protein